MKFVTKMRERDSKNGYVLFYDIINSAPTGGLVPDPGIFHYGEG